MTNVEIEVKGKPLLLETGKFAKQADGSVIARYGEPTEKEVWSWELSREINLDGLGSWWGTLAWRLPRTVQYHTCSCVRLPPKSENLGGTRLFGGQFWARASDPKAEQVPIVP